MEVSLEEENVLAEFSEDKELLATLHEYQKCGYLCDVTLVSSQHAHYTAHAAVLAAASFVLELEFMQCEYGQYTIEMPMTSVETEAFLHFAYTGQTGTESYNLIDMKYFCDVNASEPHERRIISKLEEFAEHGHFCNTAWYNLSGEIQQTHSFLIAAKFEFLSQQIISGSFVHVRETRPVSIENEFKYVCDICGEQFESRLLLLSHELYHTSDKSCSTEPQWSFYKYSMETQPPFVHQGNTFSRGKEMANINNIWEQHDHADIGYIRELKMSADDSLSAITGSEEFKDDSLSAVTGSGEFIDDSLSAVTGSEEFKDVSLSAVTVNEEFIDDSLSAFTGSQDSIDDHLYSRPTDENSAPTLPSITRKPVFQQCGAVSTTSPVISTCGTSLTGIPIFRKKLVSVVPVPPLNKTPPKVCVMGMSSINKKKSPESELKISSDFAQCGSGDVPKKRPVYVMKSPSEMSTMNKKPPVFVMRSPEQADKGQPQVQVVGSSLLSPTNKKISQESPLFRQYGCVVSGDTSPASTTSESNIILKPMHASVKPTSTKSSTAAGPLFTLVKTGDKPAANKGRYILVRTEDKNSRATTASEKYVKLDSLLKNHVIVNPHSSQSTLTAKSSFMSGNVLQQSESRCVLSAGPKVTTTSDNTDVKMSIPAPGSLLKSPVTAQGGFYLKRLPIAKAESQTLTSGQTLADRIPTQIIQTFTSGSESVRTSQTSPLVTIIPSQLSAANTVGVVMTNVMTEISTAGQDRMTDDTSSTASGAVVCTPSTPQGNIIIFPVMPMIC